MNNKNADLIVLNSLNDEGAGFKHATNKVTFITNDADPIKIGLKTKDAGAADWAEFGVGYRLFSSYYRK